MISFKKDRKYALLVLFPELIELLLVNIFAI